MKITRITGPPRDLEIEYTDGSRTHHASLSDLGDPNSLICRRLDYNELGIARENVRHAKAGGMFARGPRRDNWTHRMSRERCEACWYRKVFALYKASGNRQEDIDAAFGLLSLHIVGEREPVRQEKPPTVVDKAVEKILG